MNIGNVKITMNEAEIKKLEKMSQEALFQTCEALHTEVVQAQVMPFDSGTLQNTATSVQKVDENHVELKTVTDYAARMYYHPEYNFQKTSNPGARGRWLDDWISGSKKDWCKETFMKIFRNLGGF